MNNFILGNIVAQARSAGGGTFHAESGRGFFPGIGYGVASFGFEEGVRTLSEATLASYLNSSRVKTALEIDKKLSIGIWLDIRTNLWYFDLTEFTPNLLVAKAVGLANHQVAIWDYKNSKEIYL